MSNKRGPDMEDSSYLNDKDVDYEEEERIELSTTTASFCPQTQHAIYIPSDCNTSQKDGKELDID